MGRGSGFGKVILFGEHFVVHGVPGIVSATDAKTGAEVKKTVKRNQHSKKCLDSCANTSKPNVPP